MRSFVSGPERRFRAVQEASRMDVADLIAGTNVEPRPYQARIVTKALDHFRRGLRSVLIESPTGSGKTVMGLLVARGAAARVRHPRRLGGNAALPARPGRGREPRPRHWRRGGVPF